MNRDVGTRLCFFSHVFLGLGYFQLSLGDRRALWKVPVAFVPLFVPESGTSSAQHPNRAAMSRQ